MDKQFDTPGFYFQWHFLETCNLSILTVNLATEIVYVVVETVDESLVSEIDECEVMSSVRSEELVVETNENLEC